MQPIDPRDAQIARPATRRLQDWVNKTPGHQIGSLSLTWAECLELDAALAQIAALREALIEAKCWIVTGGRLTPEQRGAKLEWASDVEAMIERALAAAPDAKQEVGE